MSKSYIDDLIAVGKELEQQESNAHDLWTWLPSYKVTKKHHEDYVDQYAPMVKDVIQEATLYIDYLQRCKQVEISDEVVDKIIFQIGNTHDQSELWGHMRRDTSIFRLAVRMALGNSKPEYTGQEHDWFTKCACGEDHVPE